MPNLRQCLLAMGLALSLAGCGGDAQEDSNPTYTTKPLFHADANPESLSEWGLLRIEDGDLILNDGVVPYDLNSALFTDYAHKLRTVWLPDGTAAQYDASDTLDFPVGTVISKTFYYPIADGAEPGGANVLRQDDATPARLRDGFALDQVKLIETRILVHREEGWVALPYVWNADQSDAVLKRTGDIQQLTLTSAEHGEQPFNYVVPNANQCAGCHATNATTRKVQPIGPKARHLNGDFAYSDGKSNQLTKWQKLGLLEGLPDLPMVPKNAVWSDASLTVEERARSYLDINCSHCHTKQGPADTSGLLLEPESPHGPSLGVCKPPIAAGTGTGNRTFGIIPGKPDESIFTYRMESTDPAVMMPELGRSTAHDEGVALITSWIAQMDGACGKT